MDTRHKEDSIAIMRLINLVILAIVLNCSSVTTAVAVENNELIRASVIEKIARFIEWPSLLSEQLTLCAFDNTALLPALEVYYANTSLDNKSIKLVTFNHFKALLGCQIIYLAGDEVRHLETILQITKDLPILIVTEKKDSVSQGAHVDFFVEDNRLHLEVSRTALSNSNLKASYHLLGVARIVE